MKAILNKFKSMPESVKATLVFAIASFATSGINYLTTPIFTRLLSGAEYGTVAVYNSWYSIIRVFASMTLIFPGILNVGLYDHSENRWKYLSSMLGITSLCTLVLGGVYALCPGLFQNLLGLDHSLMVLMLLSCFALPATTMWTMKQRYEYRYKVTFFVSVGSAVLAQAVSVIAVLAAKENLDQVRLWSAGAVNMGVGAVLFCYILKQGRSFVDLPLWKKTFLVAIPLIPHYLGGELLSSMDKIMIDAMVGKAEAGIYSLAAILSAIGILLWRALSVMFNPFANAKLGKREFADIREAVKPLMLVVGVLCVIASLAAPEIIRILATEEYLAGVYVVPPVAAGIFIHAMYDTFAAVSFFHKKSSRIMTATLTAAAVNLVGNYLFIKWFGYIAAGYTTLLSNLVLTAMHYRSARLIEKEEIYDPGFSLGSVALVTAGCLLCNLLYPFFLIRYLCVAALLAFLWTRRKSVIDMLMNMKV
ncbi:MAG: oligosaccharide flippase family protein [Oscillospiraceae bacterium]|nr:oligosaccharide flippase family protein [Oscillospiraceae bacterium]